MKKRTIKSLELNKKIVSNLETSEVKGGTMFSIGSCTAYFYTIGITAQQTIYYVTEYLE